MLGNRDQTLNRREAIRTLALIGVSASALRQSSVSSTPDTRVTFGTSYIEQKELTLALLNTDQPAIQPLLDDYRNQTGVTIKTVVDSYDDIYTKISISLTQSTGAFDIVSLDDPWMPQFAGGDFLVDLSERMDRDGVKVESDFLPAFLGLCQYPEESNLRALPWIGNVQLFAWRRDILASLGVAPPKTWVETLNLATQITAGQSGNGVYGVGLRGRAGNPAATTFLPVLQGFGKDLFDPGSNEPQLNSRDAIAAMEMLIALKDQAPPAVDKTGHSEMTSNLLNGSIAMSADLWPDQLFRASDSEESSVAGLLEFGIQPSDGLNRVSNATGSWLLGIAGGSKNQELAAEFIYWFTAPEQQKRLLLEQKISPTRSSVLTDREVLDRYPFVLGLLTSIRRSKPRLRTPYFRALEEICGGFVSQALTGQLTAKQAMTNANTQITSLLEREGVLA